MRQEKKAGKGKWIVLAVIAVVVLGLIVGMNLSFQADTVVPELKDPAQVTYVQISKSGDSDDEVRAYDTNNTAKIQALCEALSERTVHWRGLHMKNGGVKYNETVYAMDIQCGDVSEDASVVHVTLTDAGRLYVGHNAFALAGKNTMPDMEALMDGWNPIYG